LHHQKGVGEAKGYQVKVGQPIGLTLKPLPCKRRGSRTPLSYEERAWGRGLPITVPP